MNHKRTGLIMTVTLLLAIITGCSDGSSSRRGGAGSGPAVGFVVTSANFEVGNLSTITSTSPRETTNDILGDDGVHPDSVIREFGGFVFIIQRLLSNSIIVIDPNNPSTPVANYTTNDDPKQQSDPHDIEFLSLSKAYISRYGLNSILVVNPMTGEQLSTINLSQFSDPTDSDDLVEMDHMVIVNGKLYVTLQRLTGFSAVKKSFVVVIDTEKDALVDPLVGVQKIVLEGKNPFSDLVYLPETDKIYVSNAGTFSTDDAFGGIEEIDPNTGTSKLIIPDDGFGGTLGAFAILSETVAYATVFDVNFNNLVIPFNLQTLKVGSPLTDIGTGFIPSLAFDNNGFLYVPDRDINNPGIQVFDTLTNEWLEGPIDTGLPPSNIVFVTP